MPGGNLDFGEDIFACVQRETLEETGLKVRPKKVIAYTNDVQKEAGKHEVTLYVLCEREDASQQPEVRTWTPLVKLTPRRSIVADLNILLQLKEPEKCEGWEWKAWKEITALGEGQLFTPTLNLVRTEPNLDTKFS